MANITVFDGFAFDHSKLDLSPAFTAELVEQLPTALRIALNATTQLRLTGTNFVYDAGGHATGGAVQGIESRVDGSLAFIIADAGIDLGAVLAADPANRAPTARIALFSGDDIAFGGSSRDYFNVLEGHDIVMGGGGFDIIIGGNGNDHLYGQSPNGGPDGADTIDGNDGSDYIQGNAANDEIDGGRGSDRINGGADHDDIFANEGNDTVNGNTGNDFIDGWTGNDLLRGGQGNDQITGGTGHNVVMGDLGNDTIDAQIGIDTMTGGPGADVFVLGANYSPALDLAMLRVITDFTPGEDRIEFRFGSHDPMTVLSGSATSYQGAIEQAQAVMAAHAGYREIAAIQVGADTFLFYTRDPTSDIPTTSVLAQGVVATDLEFGDFSEYF